MNNYPEVIHNTILDDQPGQPHIPSCVRKFVLDEFVAHCMFEDPQPLKAVELAPYWDEYITTCRENLEFVPRSITLETFVLLWNDLCEDRSQKTALDNPEQPAAKYD